MLVLVISIVAAVSGAVKKGPYLIFEGDNTSMTLMWQLDAAATCNIKWALDESYTNDLKTGTCTENTVYTEGLLYRYKISGLTPGTKYYYNVDGIGSGSFRTAPPDNATSTVLWGYGDSQAKENMAAAIQNQIREVYFGANGNPGEPEQQTICLRLGDWTDAKFTTASNIRNIGLETEANWTNFHFTPSHALFLSEIPMVGPLGNHESSGYFHRRYYPFPYQTKYEDKKELSENERKLNWGFNYGPVRISIFDVTYEDFDFDATYLSSEMNSAGNKWWIVLFHAPAYSAGGHSNNVKMQNAINGLTRKPNLVINGHNHYYSKCIVNTVYHVTSGGGGSDLRNPDEEYLKNQSKNSNTQIETEKDYHYFTISIQGKNLTFSAISTSGSVIDQIVFQNGPLIAELISTPFNKHWSQQVPSATQMIKKVVSSSPTLLQPETDNEKSLYLPINGNGHRQ